MKFETLKIDFPKSKRLAEILYESRWKNFTDYFSLANNDGTRFWEDLIHVPMASPEYPDQSRYGTEGFA